MRRTIAFTLLCAAACAADPLTPSAAPDAASAPDVAEPMPAHPDAGPTPAPDAGIVARPDAAAPDAAPAHDAAEPPSTPDASASTDATPTTIGETCFGDIFDPNANGPAYDQFNPTIGSHCMGTNHQAIDGIERVVFLGDSVTVGTPPTGSGDYYRNQLAARLATRFSLQAPSFGWRTVDLFNGVSNDRESGDFASCAKWGARTDDLLGPGNQLEDCFPTASFAKRTLVIMTMGGNDIAALTKDGAHSAMPALTYAQLQQRTEEFVGHLRDTMIWLKTPGRFPNGVFVIYANPPEFTDGTGQIESCGLSSIAGFDDPWPNPADLETLVIWALEQYMAVAVETGTDLVWMLEHFCGHGYVATGPDADPNNRCFRGPMAERWFDLTCIHPNPAGHSVLADMFMAVVEE